MEARKVQKVADRTVRLVEQQTTEEFKDEYLRLAKIHKTYYKWVSGCRNRVHEYVDENVCILIHL